MKYERHMSNIRRTLAGAACLVVGATAVTPLAVPAARAAESVIHLSSDGSSFFAPSSTQLDAQSLIGLTGARHQWAQGNTGAGVDVAVIDSGVTPLDGLSTPGKVVYGPDFTSDGADPTTANLDVFGHGTHMAGIIAGRDNEVTGDPTDDTTHFMGVAPDARILSVKVANADGTTTVPQVVAALNWVTDHRNDNGLHVRIVNLSLGGTPTTTYRNDQLAGAVERAWKAGLVVVAAGGNAGWTSGQLNSPAYDPYVIAVGAEDNKADGTPADWVATFSSIGNGTRNPDVLAPGTGIDSLRVPGSVIDQSVAVPEGSDPRFVHGSGSSQAAAVLSGELALALQARPGLTPDQAKSIVTKTATPLVWKDAQGNPNKWPAIMQGNGEVNLNSAMHTAPANTTQNWKTSKYITSDVTTVTLNTSGVRWTGVRWTGVRWTGVRWTGVRWSGADWG
jgi:hypothetical protein